MPRLIKDRDASSTTAGRCCATAASLADVPDGVARRSCRSRCGSAQRDALRRARRRRRVARAGRRPRRARRRRRAAAADRRSTSRKFTDGRGYSTARLLRERYGYRGELRAIGDVQRDQLFYLAQCGFDAFALRAGPRRRRRARRPSATSATATRRRSRSRCRCSAAAHSAAADASASSGLRPITQSRRRGARAARRDRERPFARRARAAASAPRTWCCSTSSRATCAADRRSSRSTPAGCPSETLRADRPRARALRPRDRRVRPGRGSGRGVRRAPTASTRFYDSVELRKACCAVRKVEPLAPRARRQARRGSRACAASSRSRAPTCRRGARRRARPRGSSTRSPTGREDDVWTYIRARNACRTTRCTTAAIRSIGCAPCTRAVEPGEDLRAGRWWWEQRRAQGMRPASPAGECRDTRRSPLECRHDRRRIPRSRTSPRSPRHAWRAADARPSGAGSSPRRSTSCARSPASARNPALLFSGGKDSLVMLRLAEKAFRPGAFRSRCCTSTPGTTSPR